MTESSYKSYDDLPLFLNAATVAKVLGVSPSSGYARQFAELDLAAEQQRIANLLQKRESPA